MTNWKKKAKYYERLLYAAVRQSATMRRLLIEYADHGYAPGTIEYEAWHMAWLTRVQIELLHWVTGTVDETA